MLISCTMTFVTCHIRYDSIVAVRAVVFFIPNNLTFLIGMNICIEIFVFRVVN